MHWNEFRTRRDDHGQSLVEFALTLLVLITIFLFILDFGRAVYSLNLITNAAQEAVRYGIVHPQDSIGIRNTAMQWTMGLNPALVEIRIQYPDASTVEVEVRYRFYPVTPLVGELLGQQGYLTLRSISRMSLS